jgi:ABC-type sugar transport system substrate-binding protein
VAEWEEGLVQQAANDVLAACGLLPKLTAMRAHDATAAAAAAAAGGKPKPMAQVGCEGVSAAFFRHWYALAYRFQGLRLTS